MDMFCSKGKTKKALLLLALFGGTSISLSGCAAVCVVGGAAMCGGGYAHYKKSKKEAPCPVCATKVRIKKAKHTLTHQGNQYYFDSAEHLQEFLKEPERFMPKPEEDSKP